jgi:hypothetical protein
MVRDRLLLGSLLLLVCALSVTACTDDGELPDDALDELDASVPGATAAIPAGCVVVENDVPQTLACTGLYGTSGTTEKSVPPYVRLFSPASPLWSDGAEKQRWLQLPEGSVIDSSKVDSWTFPVGTKAWKEFKHKGKRIETRYFLKVAPGIWRAATYLWNDAETEATRFAGGDVPVPDGTYHVPTGEECEQCHRGSRDQLLGLEPLLMGMPGAQGLTVATLTAENKLSHPPARTEYQIPDDGTGMSASVLAWMHVNCGVGCHNDNPSSYGYPSQLYLRLNPTVIQSGDLASWGPLKTTIGQLAHTSNFAGSTRIVPGSPEQSLLVQLAETRGSNRAMPPIASRIVDEQGVANLREWIRRLGDKADAGARDAGSAAGPLDALDAGLADASLSGFDAEVSDATVGGDAALADGGLVELADAGVPAVTEPLDAGVLPPVVEPVDAGLSVPVTPPVTEPVDAGVPVVAPPVTPAPLPTPPVVSPAPVVEPVDAGPVAPVTPAPTPPSFEPLDAGLVEPITPVPVPPAPMTPPVVAPPPLVEPLDAGVAVPPPAVEPAPVTPPVPVVEPAPVTPPVVAPL